MAVVPTSNTTFTTVATNATAAATTVIKCDLTRELNNVSFEQIFNYSFENNGNLMYSSKKQAEKILITSVVKADFHVTNFSPQFRCEISFWLPRDCFWVSRLCEIFRREKVELFPTSGDFAAKLVFDFHGIMFRVSRLCEIFRRKNVEIFPTSDDFASKSKISTAHALIHCRSGFAAKFASWKSVLKIP